MVRVIETTAELDRGGLVPETPKSKAGRRTVAFPAVLVPELRWHLDRFAAPGERGPVFVGSKGASLRRSNFRRAWNAACDKAGIHGGGISMIYGTRAERWPQRPEPVSRN